MTRRGWVVWGATVAAVVGASFLARAFGPGPALVLVVLLGGCGFWASRRVPESTAEGDRLGLAMLRPFTWAREHEDIWPKAFVLAASLSWIPLVSTTIRTGSLLLGIGLALVMFAVSFVMFYVHFLVVRARASESATRPK